MSPATYTKAVNSSASRHKSKRSGVDDQEQTLAAKRVRIEANDLKKPAAKATSATKAVVIKKKMNRVVVAVTTKKMTLQDKIALALKGKPVDKQNDPSTSNNKKKISLDDKIALAIQRNAELVTKAKEKKEQEKLKKEQQKLKLKAMSAAAKAKRNRKKKGAKGEGKHVTRIQRPKEFAWKGSDWEGNSDDEGSVDSAILDESICYECGSSTINDPDWQNLLICDVCDGEYHLGCMGLDRVPRNGWTCQRCYEEVQFASKNKYAVESEKFVMPRKKKGTEVSICYSPSRPLSQAFGECKSKGMMMVSRVFTYELMRKLTHGVITKMTQSGRIADTWSGATVEIAKRLNDSSHNIIDRQGRFDMRIPEFVVQELNLEEVMAPILRRLDTVMMTTKKPQLRTHNVVFCPVGSEDQIWHVDDCQRKKGSPHRYFTILIHLNHIDGNCGGTEIWCKDLRRGDLIRGRPGDAFVFPGSLLHRGRGNEGLTHRFFYYASYACDADANTDNN